MLTDSIRGLCLTTRGAATETYERERFSTSGPIVLGLIKIDLGHCFVSSSVNREVNNGPDTKTF